jgi:hypothetical protein
MEACCAALDRQMGHGPVTLVWQVYDNRSCGFCGFNLEVAYNVAYHIGGSCRSTELCKQVSNRKNKYSGDTVVTVLRPCSGPIAKANDSFELYFSVGTEQPSRSIQRLGSILTEIRPRQR